MKEDVMKRLSKVELVVFDVDGVLTDGRIYYDGVGVDMKAFDVQDGLGVSLLVRNGIKVVFMSAKSSASIRRRARDCGVEIVMEDISHKGDALVSICRELRIDLSNVVFVGDDLVDIRAMKLSGVSIAVANACREVKEVADFVTSCFGGRGAVRQVCEMILKSKGMWDYIVDEFSR